MLATPMDPLSRHFSGAVRKATSEFLQRIRRNAGFKTQGALASRLQVPLSTVQNAERGLPPSLDALCVYVQACGSSLYELLSAIDASIGLSSACVKIAPPEEAPATSASLEVEADDAE